MTSSDGLIRFGLTDWLPPPDFPVAPQFYVTTAFAVKTCDRASSLCAQAGYRVAWRRADGEIAVDVTVPVGKTAEFVMPDGKVRLMNAGRHRLVQE